MKIEKFTDVCITGGMHYIPSHTNVSTFFNFQLTFSHSPPADITLEMLTLCRATKVKVFFLLLVYIFNCDLFEFSATILEKGLLYVADTNRWKMCVSKSQFVWVLHLIE